MIDILESFKVRHRPVVFVVLSIDGRETGAESRSRRADTCLSQLTAVRHAYGAGAPKLRPRLSGAGNACSPIWRLVEWKAPGEKEREREREREREGGKERE